jgi:hypothetical protein
MAREIDTKGSLSHDTEEFLNSPSIAAVRQEERVLSLILAEQVADDPEALRLAVGATDETLVADIESVSRRLNKRDRPSWEALKVIRNTDEILTQKGSIICRIIMIASEDGETALSILSS